MKKRITKNKDGIPLMGDMRINFKRWLELRHWINYRYNDFWDLRHFILLKEWGYKFGFFIQEPNYKGFISEIDLEMSKNGKNFCELVIESPLKNMPTIKEYEENPKKYSNKYYDNQI